MPNKSGSSAATTRARLNDTFLIELEERGDNSGFLARTMCTQEFAVHGLDTDYVQQNTSFSLHAGTIRSMHNQLPPHHGLCSAMAPAGRFGESGS